MLVLMIEPGEAPRRLELSHSLEEMQKAVGGFIQILYPFEDPVALVCNEEGKLLSVKGIDNAGHPLPDQRVLYRVNFDFRGVRDLLDTDKYVHIRFLLYKLTGIAMPADCVPVGTARSAFHKSKWDAKMQPAPALWSGAEKCL